MKKYVSVQFYSTRQWTEDELRDFQLLGNPYKGTEEVLDALREKGVFFYRDARHGSQGIILAKKGDTRFQGFKYSANMETDNRTYCKAYTWPIAGDPYFILEFTSTSVRAVRIENAQEPEERKAVRISGAINRATSGSLDDILTKE